MEAAAEALALALDAVFEAAAASAPLAVEAEEGPVRVPLAADDVGLALVQEAAVDAPNDAASAAVLALHS